MAKQLSEPARVAKRAKEIQKVNAAALKAQKERKAKQAKREAEVDALKAKKKAAQDKAIAKFTTTKKAEISAWLEGGKDFDTGYALLCEVSNNRGLLAQTLRKRRVSKVAYELERKLKMGVIAPSKVKLSKAVRKHITPAKDITPSPKKADKGEKKETKPINSEKGNVPSPEEIEKAADEKAAGEVTAIIVKKSGGKVDPNNFPEEISPYYERACKYHRIMQLLHTKLDVATADEERKSLMDELLTVEKDHTSCWAIIDTWLKDGKLPEAPKAPKVQKSGNAITDNTKALNAAKTYLTKNLRKLETLKGEALEAKKKDVAIRVQLLKEYEMLPIKHMNLLGKYGFLG